MEGNVRRPLDSQAPLPRKTGRVDCKIEGSAILLLVIPSRELKNIVLKEYKWDMYVSCTIL